MTQRNCSVDGCDRKAHAFGWCSMHYRRWARNGDPMRTRFRGPDCSVEGCDRPHSAKGYCALHYQRIRHNGTVDRATPEYPGVQEAFRARVGEPTETGCTEWIGGRSDRGYGMLAKGRKNVLAHRYAYEEAFGPIPDAMLVRHKCDNPPCVNPDHLELGTVKDNSRDSVVRGRSARGEGIANSVLTHAEAQEIWDRRGTARKTDLAKEFGVSPSAIAHIHTGHSWKYIDRS